MMLIQATVGMSSPRKKAENEENKTTQCYKCCKEGKAAKRQGCSNQRDSRCGVSEAKGPSTSEEGNTLGARCG